MKKILLLFTILSVSVITTACINNLAIQELNNKAESYMGKGDTQAAICRLKSSLDLDDSVYQTHYNLAVAYNNTNNYEAALDELNKVLELKPDFADAYYTMGIVKEAIAYKSLNKNDDENKSAKEATMEEIAAFNQIAAEAIEKYNEYLVKKVNPSEVEQINDKIAELNQKIKEYTEIYDKQKSIEDKKIEQEMNSEEKTDTDASADSKTKENSESEE